MKLARRARERAYNMMHGIPNTETPYSIETYRTLRVLRHWSQDDVILDVGANDGRTIIRWRRHLPQTRIVAFEPVGRTFATLKSRTADLDGITYHQLALGTARERRDIFLDESAALHSFYADRVGSGGSETVEVETLDAVMEREGITHAALLKIDAEGHDLEVLKGAGARLGASSFALIQVEAGFSAPGLAMPSLAEFQDYLAPFGYHLRTITNQCTMPLGRLPGTPMAGDPDTRILTYCDAIFVPATHGR